MCLCFFPICTRFPHQAAIKQLFFLKGHLQSFLYKLKALRRVSGPRTAARQGSLRPCKSSSTLHDLSMWMELGSSVAFAENKEASRGDRNVDISNWPQKGPEAKETHLGVKTAAPPWLQTCHSLQNKVGFAKSSGKHRSEYRDKAARWRKNWGKGDAKRCPKWKSWTKRGAQESGGRARLGGSGMQELIEVGDGGGGGEGGKTIRGTEMGSEGTPSLSGVERLQSGASAGCRTLEWRTPWLPARTPLGPTHLLTAQRPPLRRAPPRVARTRVNTPTRRRPAHLPGERPSAPFVCSPGPGTAPCAAAPPPPFPGKLHPLCSGTRPYRWVGHAYFSQGHTRLVGLAATSYSLALE